MIFLLKSNYIDEGSKNDAAADDWRPDIMKRITKFRGANFFLSNFYPTPVKYQGLTYQNNEAAFQAAKVANTSHRNQQVSFTQLTPAAAKRKGRHVQLRSDWEKVKDQVMFDVVYAKFSGNPTLTKKLLATEDAILVEGNTWHDTYWGYDMRQKRGQNKLGKILMQVRRELRSQQQP